MKRRNIRLVVDGPGVFGRPGTGGETGDERIEPFPTKPVLSDRGGIGHIAKPDRGACELWGDIVKRRGGGTRADEAHHVVTCPDEGPDAGAPDGPGRADDEDAPGHGRLVGH